MRAHALKDTKTEGEAGLRLVLNEMGQPTGLSVSAPKLDNLVKEMDGSF